MTPPLSLGGATANIHIGNIQCQPSAQRRRVDFSCYFENNVTQDHDQA